MQHKGHGAWLCENTMTTTGRTQCIAVTLRDNQQLHCCVTNELLKRNYDQEFIDKRQLRNYEVDIFVLCPQCTVWGQPLEQRHAACSMLLVDPLCCSHVSSHCYWVSLFYCAPLWEVPSCYRIKPPPVFSSLVDMIRLLLVWMSCLDCQSVASVPSLVASLYVSLYSPCLCDVCGCLLLLFLSLLL